MVRQKQDPTIVEDVFDIAGDHISVLKKEVINLEENLRQKRKRESLALLDLLRKEIKEMRRLVKIAKE